MNTTPAPHSKTGTAFRWSRFSALVRVDLAERWAGYGGVLLISAVIQLLLLSWITLSSAPMPRSAQMGWYYGFLFSFGVVFCFVFYAPMQKQGASLLALMRPASVLEKWLHAALLLLVGFPLAHTLVFLVISVPINAFAAIAEAARVSNSHVAADQLVGLQVFLPFLPERDGDRGVNWAHMVFHWWYLIIAGFGAFALVRFTRAAALKTFALALILLILTAMALSASSGTGSLKVLSHWWSSGNHMPWSVTAVVANLLFWLGMPSLLWCSTYLALRERDLS